MHFLVTQHVLIRLHSTARAPLRLLPFKILEVASNLLDSGSVALSISVIEEILVTAVNPFHAQGVLDRTPILLRARRDFCHIGEDAIGVATILAVQLLDQI